MSSVLRLQFWHPDVCSHGIRMDCYTAVRAALEALPSPRFPRSCRRLLPFFGVVSCRIGIGQCFLPFLTLAGVQKERFFLCGGLTGIRINCLLILFDSHESRLVLWGRCPSHRHCWDTQVWSHERSKMLINATWRDLLTYIYVLLHGVYTFLCLKQCTKDILDWWRARLHNVIEGYRRSLSPRVALEATTQKKTKKRGPIVVVVYRGYLLH